MASLDYVKQPARTAPYSVQSHTGSERRPLSRQTPYRPPTSSQQSSTSIFRQAETGAGFLGGEIVLCLPRAHHEVVHAVNTLHRLV